MLQNRERERERERESDALKREKKRGRIPNVAEWSSQKREEKQ